MAKFRLDEFGIPKISRSDLEMRVESNFLSHFAPDCLKQAKATPIASIAMQLKEKFGLKLDLQADLGHRDGKKVRGCYSLDARRISIDQSLEPGSPPFNFTLAHEIGHFVLHRQLTPVMLDRIDGNTIQDDDRSLVLDQLECGNPRSWLEWQANKFASSLLLPRKTVPGFVLAKQKERGVVGNLGTLYLDRQSGNVEDFYAIVKEMEFIYQVSRLAIRIRLRELNILEDNANKGDFAAAEPVSVKRPLHDLLGSLAERLKNEGRG